MQEDNIPDIISKLIKLSETDLKYTQVLAEKKKLEADLKEKTNLLNELKTALEVAKSAYQEKELLFNKQDKHIKGEKEKLVQRRKALSSLNDYKTQQKAEKEIEHANKQLSVQEDKLVEFMDASDDAKAKKEDLANRITEVQGELDSFQAESEDHFKNIEERLVKYQTERQQLDTDVPLKVLNIYKRVSQRYPGGAIVPLKGNLCSGCFCSLRPQILQQVARAAEMVTCQNCGRLLYLLEEKASN